MRYEKVIPAVFLERPNRFIARVRTDRGAMNVHVKNTGRCRELLLPRAEVYIAMSSNPARKTPGDLIAVRKGDRLINMDSQAPNQATEEALAAGLCLPGMEAAACSIRPEIVWGGSRLDFYLQWPGGAGANLAPPHGLRLPEGCGQGFLEVKGVTLEQDGGVFFPDAPTERGVKHLRELIQLSRMGYPAWVLFVIQMDGVDFFAPNDATHPAFGLTLRQAAAAGVGVAAYDCLVESDTLTLGKPVKVRL